MTLKNTAKKIRINTLLNAKYVKEEGMNPNYLILNNEKIFHVNIIGVVVQTDDDFVVIDDGSGKISLRSFEEVTPYKNISVGDIVLVIGKPREYNEKYILAEITKKINNPLWIKVREKEIQSEKININPTVEEINLPTEYHQAGIIQLIKQLDEGNGAPIEKILIKLPGSENQLEQLKKNGEIFETISGWLKVLD